METLQKPKLTPRDFFFYFGALITLYWSAGSLIALVFRIIDTVFRDSLDYYIDPYSSGIRFAIASLVVVFPLSLLLFRTIKKEVMREPAKLLLPLRRWLYALTVFVTAVALIGDVIALLNSFLGGELTTRFALKVLTVFVVAGLVFWYCLIEIRSRPEAPAEVRGVFLWGAPILVLAAVIYGFTVMGSPSLQRSLRFDERRVGDLQSIQWQIVNYWQQKGQLPTALAELEDSISGYRVPSDPDTGEKYGFEVGGERSFALCATFERATSEKEKGEAARAPYYSGALSENWEHEAGKECFERTIDPELYPLNPKSVPLR